MIELHSENGIIIIDNKMKEKMIFSGKLVCPEISHVKTNQSVQLLQLLLSTINYFLLFFGHKYCLFYDNNHYNILRLSKLHQAVPVATKVDNQLLHLTVLH